ncbi:MAG: response regulator transcription factor [Defluviitaleaceae bacterium]|nr:response regulator transcription factor [Defluviitaleaceae bacterium]
MKLLIVEDELSLQKALYKGFRKLDYTVDTASDGEEALELFFSNVYGLVVLDLNLPKLNGMEVLKEIRVDNKEIPVLILSAKGEVADKIAGLDEGANDYLAKPFNFAELEARVRALLRRNFKTSDTVIEAGAVKVDTATKRVFVLGEEVGTTQKEYAIIEYLFLRKGEAISPTKMIEQIWENDTEDIFNSFKVHLGNLRKKLPDGFIKNTRGRGYYVE